MANRFWVGGGSAGNWNSTGNTNWSATSGGANNASVPTAADDVFFDASSTGTCTINSNVACHSIDMTGSNATLAGSGTRTFTVGGAATTASASVCKLLNTTGASFSAVTLNFDNRSGGITVTALGGTGWGGPMATLTTHTTTVTFSTDFTSGNLTHGRSTISVASGKTLNSTGTITDGGSSQTKTFSYANATIQCSAWGFNGSGALTMTGDANSLLLITFGGGIEWSATLASTYPGTNSGKGVRFTGSGQHVLPLHSTFGRLTYIQPALSSAVTFGATTPTAITTFECVGIDAHTRFLVTGNSVSAPTINATNTEFTNVDLHYFVNVGTGTSVTNVAVGDCGNNSNVSVTTPTTRYWVGNGGSWESTAHWSASSGGSSGASVPLPQDTAIIDNSSITTTGQTITQNDTSTIRYGAIDCSGCTNNAFTLILIGANAQMGACGNLTLSAQATVTGTWGILKSSSITFTQNGATCTGLAIRGRGLSSSSCILLAGSDMSVGACQWLTTVYGTGSCDMNGFNFTATNITVSSGTFTVSSSKTLTITAASTSFSINSPGQISTDGTADLVFSNAGSSTATTASNSNSWRNITCNGTILTFVVSAGLTVTCDRFIFTTAAAALIGPASGNGFIYCKWIDTNATFVIANGAVATSDLHRSIAGDQILQRTTFRGLGYTGISPDVNTYGGGQSIHSGSQVDSNVSLSNSPRVRGCPV